MSVVGTTAERKMCIGCGADVTSTRRFRDAGGRYYCERCNQVAGAQSSAPPTKLAGPKPQSEVIEPPDANMARSLGLLARVICAHCWHSFPPEQTLWVSQHSDLIGDAVLGPEKARRFLPSRFTPDGQAIDARGMACQTLACPRCHLPIPRSVIETAPLFLSMIGGPRSGKSYLLASMTWELRRLLPADFGLAFTDADTVSNQALNEYEATLFLPEDADAHVAIRKTEEQGELYDQIHLGGQDVTLPRPFLFNVRPTARHPRADQRARLSRVLCMYDNAGESFQPGKDRAGSPVTMHLARSRVLMFVFDPTQDPRFRDQCVALSQDPQLGIHRSSQRQETLLLEAAQRVRQYANLPPNKKHGSPLLVIVPKADVWSPLLGDDLAQEPILRNTVPGTMATVDSARIEQMSAKLRAILLKWTPEIVSAAEDFCDHVLYIPVSALGCSPELVEGKPGLYVRPKNIFPRWAAVPLLYMFAKWTTELVAGNARVVPAKPAPIAAMDRA